ncbi:MAG: NADH:ubiquinone reductase (Na(+)-transporting) subunit D [Rikenellaceae bacterium]
MSAKKKTSFFKSEGFKLLTSPFNQTNPVTVQILGICSALAVTAKMKPAFVMSLSVIVVTALASFVISLIRNSIPSRIRIIVQLVIVAALVILVDQVLKAFVYDVSKQLSVFVGLIITNCIIMGRIEAFALANKPIPALIDGAGSGIGYGIILITLGFFRELLGAGTVWGCRVIPEAWYIKNGGFYDNNALMLLPPMALICVGIIIWIHRSRNKSLIEK